jgi:hypothetical protein
MLDINLCSLNMHPFSIRVQISFSDYLRGNYKLLYSTLWMKTTLGVAFASIIYYLIMYATNNLVNFNSWFFFIAYIISISAVFTPLVMLLIYISAYKTDKRIKEEILYEFNSSGVKVTGESFNFNFDWKSIHKIKILNGWLFIYQNRLSASMIKIDKANEENVKQLPLLLKIGNKV